MEKVGIVGSAWGGDWRDPEALALPDDFLAEVPEPVRSILWRRGFRTDDAARAFLDPVAFQLADEPLAPALPVAVERLLAAHAGGERVAVWGDYDVDGLTATALLVGVLRRLDFDVAFHIHACDDDRRGMAPEGLQALAEQQTRLLVTCDCGTNDGEMVAYARTLGMEVIITDHHVQTTPAPEAVAVLNSSHLAQDDPLWGLSGVAVAFLLARGLLRRCDAALEANRWLDLVALGTVADVTPGSPANRALLARGLARLWRRRRPGIQALLAITGRRPSGLDTETISFALAPILNAAGRLGAPRACVDLLLTEDAAEAQRIATHLRTLHAQRNRTAAAIEAEIAEQVRDDGGPVIAVGSDWQPSVLGRVAGAIAHRARRPAVVISVPAAGGLARGSARAAGAIDLCAVLAARRRQLIGFGGHAHAAGFSLHAADVQALTDDLRAALACHEQEPAVQVDAVFDWAALPSPGASAAELLDLLLRLAPHCAGNAAPIFTSHALRLAGCRRFGAGGRHLELTLADAEGHTHPMIWWRADAGWRHEGYVDVAYTITRDDWQRAPTLQLTLCGIRPHQQQSIG